MSSFFLLHSNVRALFVCKQKLPSATSLFFSFASNYFAVLFARPHLQQRRTKTASNLLFQLEKLFRALREKRLSEIEADFTYFHKKKPYTKRLLIEPQDTRLNI